MIEGICRSNLLTLYVKSASFSPGLVCALLLKVK